MNSLFQSLEPGLEFSRDCCCCCCYRRMLGFGRRSCVLDFGSLRKLLLSNERDSGVRKIAAGLQIEGEGGRTARQARVQAAAFVMVPS